MRTTAEAVREIVGLPSTASVDGFIETATLLVDEVAACDSSASYAKLELIERWLAAHFARIKHPHLNSKSLGAASASFGRGSVGMRLDSTPEGQQALMLDTSGCLQKKTSTKARVFWGGSTVEKIRQYE